MTRLKLRHAVSGRPLCFPGPATADNGWSLPNHVFLVGNLLGHYVYPVGDNGAHEKSHMKVTAVLMPTGEIAHRAWDLKDIAEDGWVSLVTGDKVLPFKGLACNPKPCADVSDVLTPPTPPPYASYKYDVS